MKKIYLGGKYGSVIGNYALVDDEVYEKVSKYNWTAQKHGNTFYAIRRTNGKTIRMHRLVWEAFKGEIEDGKEIDHIDGSGLSNCLKNLRSVTHQQNTHNRRACKNSFSKYKGVFCKKSNGKWYAEIGFDGKKIHLGYFINEIDAAMAYDYTALKYFGENAYLNFSDFDYKNYKSKRIKLNYTSTYRGVCRKEKVVKYVSKIGIDGKYIHLGYFTDEIEAAKAYDFAALKYRGDKAQLNFPKLIDEYRAKLGNA